MVVKTITDSDKIIVQSVDSYLSQMGPQQAFTQYDKALLTQHARDRLYSDIVHRIPRVAAYILSIDLEQDANAKGFLFAIEQHAMDPVFIDLLMQYLAQRNDQTENGIVGALLARIINKYLEQNTVKTVEKPKKGEKTETAKTDVGPIEHLRMAMNHLLGSMAGIITARAGNLNHNEALGIAACIAMNNRDTIIEVMKLDLPITAQLFNINQDPGQIVAAALLLEKKDFTKLTANQTAFIDSLKRWVYERLNGIPTHTMYQWLISVYGSAKPDVSKYLINIKDCGTQFSNLMQIAKQLINI